MGLLDYLFGGNVDPAAAHNAALHKFLMAADSHPDIPSPGIGATQPAIGGDDVSPSGPSFADISKFLTAQRGQAPSMFAPEPQTPNEYYPQQPTAMQVQQRQGLPQAWETSVTQPQPLPGSPAPAIPQQPAAATPTPQPTPGIAPGAPGNQAAPAPAGGQFQPDLIDRISAFGHSLAHDGSISGAFGAAAGAQDPNALRIQQATYDAILKKSKDPVLAKAAALNPQFGNQVMAHMFPELTDIGTGIYGPIKGWANPLDQTVTGVNGQPASTLTGPGGGQDVMQLMHTDPGFAADVKAYAQGREMPTGRPGPYQAAVRRAAQLAYNTDESTYNTRLAQRKNMEVGGKGADFRTAMNTAIDHFSKLSDDAEALHNVSGAGILNRPLNEAWNALASARGETPRDKALVKFQQTKKMANKEFNEAYIKGGGTEGERAALEADINAAGTMPQLRAAISNAIHMLQSKTVPMEDQWNRTFSGTGEKFDMVSEENKQKINKVLRRAGEISPMFGQAGAASQMPSGQLAQFAQDAISKGANPQAVLKRMQSMGGQ